MIISSDKDFLGLLGPRTHQVRLSSASTPTDRWTQDRMIKEYGCHPRDWAKVLALAGDVSDNVPGVRGFGVKTAVKKLAAAGWQLDSIEDERVVTAREQVQLNYRLVDLRSQPPAPYPAPVFQPTRPGDAAWGPLEDYLLLYQLETVRQSLYQRTLWTRRHVTDTAKINPAVH